MATTVNGAFSEFMRETVNLDQEKTKTARSSRDNLIDNIKDLVVKMISSKYMMIKFYALDHLNGVQK